MNNIIIGSNTTSISCDERLSSSDESESSCSLKRHHYSETSESKRIKTDLKHNMRLLLEREMLVCVDQMQKIRISGRDYKSEHFRPIIARDLNEIRKYFEYIDKKLKKLIEIKELDPSRNNRWILKLLNFYKNFYVTNLLAWEILAKVDAQKSEVKALKSQIEKEICKQRQDKLQLQLDSIRKAKVKCASLEEKEKACRFHWAHWRFRSEFYEREVRFQITKNIGETLNRCALQLLEHASSEGEMYESCLSEQLAILLAQGDDVKVLALLLSCTDYVYKTCQDGKGYSDKMDNLMDQIIDYNFKSPHYLNSFVNLFTECPRLDEAKFESCKRVLRYLLARNFEDKAVEVLEMCTDLIYEEGYLDVYEELGKIEALFEGYEFLSEKLKQCFHDNVESVLMEDEEGPSSSSDKEVIDSEEVVEDPSSTTGVESP